MRIKSVTALQPKLSTERLLIPELLARKAIDGLLIIEPPKGTLPDGAGMIAVYRVDLFAGDIYLALPAGPFALSHRNELLNHPNIKGWRVWSMKSDGYKWTAIFDPKFIQQGIKQRTFMDFARWRFSDFVHDREGDNCIMDTPNVMGYRT